MKNTVIYHNPRCSKSRQTLQRLRDRQMEPEIVEYLKTPLDRDALRDLLTKLNCDSRLLVREKECLELGFSTDLNSEEIIDLISENPQVMQRPIVVHQNRAVIGRPVSNVEALLDG